MCLYATPLDSPFPLDKCLSVYDTLDAHPGPLASIIGTYIHTHTYTYAHTHTPTYTHTSKLTYTNTHVQVLKVSALLNL